MAEEEKNDDQQAPEQETPAAEETPAEETPAAEEAPPEEPAAEAAPEAAAEPAAEAEPAEQLSPRERRRRERSLADGPGGPPRSVEDRLRERAEQRARKAQERRRWRQKQREKRRAGPQAEAPPSTAEPREAGKRKSRQGVVVSSKADKTITVRIDRVARHRVYGKVVRETGTLHVHDERNEANEGDVVRVTESRPLSRTKRWRLDQVLEKAR
jgi:small subunit ribosomal protein S17